MATRKPKVEAAPEAAPKVKKTTTKATKTAKEIATEAGEPYVAILSVELDPENVGNGAFELDWNSIFITQLVKAGYMKKKDDTDQDIVDRWFQDICRTVVLEYYQQQQADPDNRYRTDIRVVRTKDIGDGRSEVS